jgi:tetratricopeptide (TPR) repeat protein
MRRVTSSAVFLVLALMFCQRSVAQEFATLTSWDTCLKAPTRTCILDEALIHALAVEPSENRTGQLGSIAEAYAAAGNVQAALRAAQSIPPDQASRVTALRSIAAAQARLGLAGDAKETFIQARQRADALKGQLSRAEVLHSLDQAEAEAGMGDDATGTFEESLKLAEVPEILASSPCVTAPSAESRLDTLLARLAEQQARAGNLSNSLRAARSIKYVLSAKAGALRVIAEIQAQNGLQNEARLILTEALEAVHASQTPIEYWPSCPKQRHVAVPSSSYVEMLCDVAKAQAKVGRIADAAATLDEALQVVPSIKDPPLPKEVLSDALAFMRADVTKSLALSAIAKAQDEAGLKTQSAATFERAKQAASEVRAASPRIMALNRLGRAQYQAGRVAGATRAFDDALELARGLDNPAMRVFEFVNVLSAKLDVGVAVEGDSTLLEGVEIARSIAGEAWRAVALQRLALAQDRIGRREDAVATYREALEATDAIPSSSTRSNVLFGMITGMPVGPQPPRLIAESAQQAARIAQSIEGELRRASALVVIARALPN